MFIPLCNCCGHATIRKYKDGEVAEGEEREIWHNSHTGGDQSWGVAVYWRDWEDEGGEDGVLHEFGNFVTAETSARTGDDSEFGGIIVAYRDDGDSQVIVWESDDVIYSEIRDEEYQDRPSLTPSVPPRNVRGRVGYPGYVLDGRENFYAISGGGYVGLITGSLVRWTENDDGEMEMVEGWTADKVGNFGFTDPDSVLGVNQFALQEDGSMHCVLAVDRGGFGSVIGLNNVGDAGVISSDFVLGATYRDTYEENANYPRAGYYSNDDGTNDSSSQKYVGLRDDGGFFVVSEWVAAQAYPAQTPYDFRINVVDADMAMLYEVDIYGTSSDPFLTYNLGSLYSYTIRWNLSVTAVEPTMAFPDAFDGVVGQVSIDWHALGWYFSTAPTMGRYQISDTFTSGEIPVIVDWDADAAAIQAALEAAWPGTISVTGSGTYEDPFLIDHDVEGESDQPRTFVVSNFILATLNLNFHRCFCRGSGFWWQAATYSYQGVNRQALTIMFYADLEDGTPAQKPDESEGGLPNTSLITESESVVRFDGDPIQGRWDFARWVDGFLYVYCVPYVYQVTGNTANWRFPATVSSLNSVRKHDGYLYLSGQWGGIVGDVALEGDLGTEQHTAKVDEATGEIVWQESHAPSGSSGLMCDTIKNGEFVYAVGVATTSGSGAVLG